MLSNWYEYRCQNTPAYTPNTSTNTLPILWLQTRCWFNTQLTQKQNATSIKIEINLKVSAMESVCNLLFFDPFLSSLADGLACIWHGKALNLDYIFLRDFFLELQALGQDGWHLGKSNCRAGGIPDDRVDEFFHVKFMRIGRKPGRIQVTSE